MTQMSSRTPTKPAEKRLERPAAAVERKLFDGNRVAPGLATDDRRLYSRPVVVERELAQHQSRYFEVFGEKADAKSTLFKKHGMDMVRETGQDTAARLLGHFITAEIAEARRTDDRSDTEARAKTLRHNAEESRRRLQETYGADRAPGILTRVRKFIRSNAAVSRVLASHDLAEHPDVIGELADLVYRTNYR